MGPDGQPMNPEEAWELIHATLGDESYEVTEIELDDPPGKKGFVIIRETEVSRRCLYIKLELGSGVVIGRSFHLSIYG